MCATLSSKDNGVARLKQFLKLPPAHSLWEAALKCVNAVRARIPQWLAPAIFGAVLAQGVNAYFKPSLSATLAWSDAVTITYAEKPTLFLATLIDWFPTGQAQLVAPRLITFNSENEFQRVPNDSLRIVKILITNVGFATAKRIRAGIGLPPGWNVVVSPNVEVTNEKTIQPMGDYPGYRVIEISRLTVGETAVFTITGPCLCSFSKAPHVSEDGKLFLPTEKNVEGYAPLLFITDEDGSSIQYTAISMKEALAQEHSYFPTTSAGFWAEGLKVKDGVSPTVKPLEHLTIPWQTKDGRPMELTTDHPTKLD